MEAIIKPFLDLLKEIYVGGEGQDTFIIDRKPGYGIMSAVKTLSAKEISTPSHEGGTTIAAHTGHLKWSLDYAMEFYKGNMPNWNWDDSWTRHTVNEKEWQQLQEDLSASYNKLTQAISGVKDWSNPALVKGTLALLPHASYHLGAIKQLMLVVNERQEAMKHAEPFA